MSTSRWLEVIDISVAATGTILEPLVGTKAIIVFLVNSSKTSCQDNNLSQPIRSAVQVYLDENHLFFLFYTFYESYWLTYILLHTRPARVWTDIHITTLHLFVYTSKILIILQLDPGLSSDKNSNNSHSHHHLWINIFWHPS